MVVWRTGGRDRLGPPALRIIFHSDLIMLVCQCGQEADSGTVWDCGPRVFFFFLLLFVKTKTCSWTSGVCCPFTLLSVEIWAIVVYVCLVNNSLVCLL